MGNDTGTLVGSVTYTTGESGNAFQINAAGSGIVISNGPNLQNLQLQSFTVEAWVRRSSLSSVSSPSGAAGIIFGYGHYGYAFALGNDGSPLLTEVDSEDVTGGTPVTDLNYHHVAVTKSGSTVIFYTDGVASSSFSVPYTFQFGTAAAIGARSDTMANTFLGDVDEVSVYNRALAQTEIQAIYQAGSAGKCLTLAITTQPTNEVGVIGRTNTFSVQAIGFPPLSYQWFFDTELILNATNVFLTITNVQETNAGTYTVLVSDTSDRLLSSNATLTVVAPVVITNAPTNQLAILGATETFYVGASGTPPLHYQWAFDGTNIANATNTAYSVTNVQYSDYGSYTVVVTNLGSAASGGPALLAFNPEVTVNGQGGANFVIPYWACATVQITSSFTNATIFYT